MKEHSLYVIQALHFFIALRDTHTVPVFTLKVMETMKEPDLCIWSHTFTDTHMNPSIKDNPALIFTPLTKPW